MRDFYVRTYILDLNLVVEGGTGVSRYIKWWKGLFYFPLRVVVVAFFGFNALSSTLEDCGVD